MTDPILEIALGQAQEFKAPDTGPFQRCDVCRRRVNFLFFSNHREWVPNRLFRACEDCRRGIGTRDF